MSRLASAVFALGLAAAGPILAQSSPTPSTESARAAAARERLAAQVAEGQKILARLDPAASPPRNVVEAKSHLEALLRQAERSGATLTPQAADSLRGQILNSAAALRTLAHRAAAPAAATLAAGPPDSLLAAAAAYFRGDYAAALKELEAAQYEDPRASAQARLFRAAASYDLFVLGGGTDPSLREHAARDVRECRQLDPKLTPSAAAFSPRFAEFFEQNKG